jgi:UDP-N-acetylglucosamine 2-epimerase
MHGTLGPEYLIKCMAVDKLFLFGSLDFEKMMSINIDNNSIELTGAPYLDKLNRNLDYYKANARDSKFERKVLVALSGPGTSVSLDNHRLIIKWVMQLAELHSNSLFSIKLHRKDKVCYFEDFLKLRNVELILQNHELVNDIFYWISINELIITGASTVGLECHLLGKPSICVDPLGELKNTYYVPDNRIEYLSTFNELNLTFSRFIEKGANFKDESYFESVIADYFYRFDGKSSERVVNSVIKDLC